MMDCIKKKKNHTIMKHIFKEGDQVYHWKYGRGRISQIYQDNSMYVNFIDAYFKDVYFSDQFDHDVLSFTPYNLVDGGLTHERPVDDEQVKLLTDFLNWSKRQDVLYGRSWINEDQFKAKEFLKQYK